MEAWAWGLVGVPCALPPGACILAPAGRAAGQDRMLWRGRGVWWGARPARPNHPNRPNYPNRPNHPNQLPSSPQPTPTPSPLFSPWQLIKGNTWGGTVFASCGGLWPTFLLPQLPQPPQPPQTIASSNPRLPPGSLPPCPHLSADQGQHMGRHRVLQLRLLLARLGHAQPRRACVSRGGRQGRARGRHV